MDRSQETLDSFLKVEGMFQRIFEAGIEVKILPNKDESGVDSQVRLENFFTYLEERGHTASISLGADSLYEIALSVKGNKQKLTGLGVTINLALNDLWDDMKKYNIK